MSNTHKADADTKAPKDADNTAKTNDGKTPVNAQNERANPSRDSK